MKTIFLLVILLPACVLAQSCPEPDYTSCNGNEACINRKYDIARACLEANVYSHYRGTQALDEGISNINAKETERHVQERDNAVMNQLSEQRDILNNEDQEIESLRDRMNQ